MDKYQDYFKTISQITSIPKNDFYDNKGFDLEAEFDEVYSFYQEALNQNYNLGISPAFIYFNNGTDVNARATKIDNNYIISLNKGMIFKLVNQFRDNTAILNRGLGSRPVQRGCWRSNLRSNL